MPDDVNNSEAHAEVKRYTENHALIYTCIFGFGLKSGNLKRTCGQDGKWSGSPPVCGKISHMINYIKMF